MILVIEDDVAIGVGIKAGLQRAGFDVELVHNGDEGLRQALCGRYALLVLDWMLPGTSGAEILEALRDRSSVPVIVLTARTGLAPRLEAFSLGAVDFLPKPFWVAELVARVQARLGTNTPNRVVSFLGVSCDLDARSVVVDGHEVGLTAHEFNLLAYLVERPTRPITRDQLIQHALPLDSGAMGRTIDSHVARIRKKLGAAGRCIETVWRVGYRYQPPP